MQERIFKRYSLAFKQEVIREVESGRFASVNAARQHYGIGGVTLGKWLKRFGKSALQGRTVRVEMQGEADRILELRKQVAQLERALGQTQAQNLLNEGFLKRACELLGQEVEGFKKKNGGSSCTGSVPGAKGGG
jgi:transposase-like protein